MSVDGKLYSIKMRASKKENDRDVHLSGAEKIVAESDVDAFSSALIERGMHHAKGEADFLNLKINRVREEDIIYLDALPVETVEVESWQQGHEEIRRYLREIDISDPERIMRFLDETYAMRGAMLLDVDRCVRLEPDKTRGIRATNMDQERSEGETIGNEKNHYEEAIVLATKVVNCPGIIGEICISDDPNYVTGYVSSKQIGYRRITKMKEMGSENGGRIFLFRGTDKEADAAIDFLQNQHVIVRNVEKNIVKKSWMSKNSKWDRIDQTLVSLQENNLFRTMKTIESAQSSHITIEGKDYVLMASNDYLDIANHSSVKAAAIEAVSAYGFGSGGSRLTTGNTLIHDALERKIAAYKETEAAIVFNTGYVANLATISAMVKKGDIIFSDALNHASIIDGCRLSKAKIVTYAHNDMDDLRRKIKENPCENGIVVSDAVFSMDGDILKLPEFLDICEDNNLFSMVDEAHSTGVIGETGHGIREFWHEKRHVDILMGTLSKSVGGEGGYVAGEKRLIEYLRNKARGFIFSTSLSPVTMAANLAGIEVLEKETSRVRRLQENVIYFCNELAKYGIDAKSETAIIPIIIGDEGKAVAVSSYLYDHGYFISAIRFPTVAKGAARLRVALMSSHTEEELSRCAELIHKAFVDGKII